jgi:cyclophilin family peptidyl-prolyl cis-trans isomerase/HEAT repeat protein
MQEAYITHPKATTQASRRPCPLGWQHRANTPGKTPKNRYIRLMKSKNPHRFLAALFLLLIAAAACKDPATTRDAPLPLNKFDDPRILRIYDLADRRAADSLRPFLQDSNARYRKEAAIAMGSVQDSLAAPQLVRLLDDTDAEVAKAAAWALGQIGDSSYAEELVVRFPRMDEQMQAPMGEALGKCGSKSQIDSAFAQFRKGRLNTTDAAISQMLYRAGLRRIVPAGAADYAIQTLKSTDHQARLYAAAYLGRAADLGPITDPKPILSFLKATSTDAEEQARLIQVRQHQVKSLRRCALPECTQELRNLILDRSQPTAVRVNAIRAAGTVHAINTEAMTAVLDSNQQVAVTAAEHIRDHIRQDYAPTLDLCRQVKAWRPRAILLAAAMADAASRNHFTGRTAVITFIDSIYTSAGPYEKGALLTALGKDFEQRDRLLQTALKKEKVVSTYAAEALIASNEASASRSPAYWFAQVKQLMATGDPGLVAMATDHLAGESPVAMMIRTQNAKDTTFLADALRQLKLPADIEAYNAVEKAMAAFKGIPPQLTHLDAEHPVDWDLVKRIPSGQTAVVQTSKGNVTFRLQVEDAPGTVANFVKLVQQGFYNGKTFHRIVPAFVAQGGCPRGDGWGSTPETIRSEWPALHYEAGVVGMASAGKDTESCQWFITHCSTPHLDGRYTIFARVVEGMEVVERLEIGDNIVAVTLPGLAL